MCIVELQASVGCLTQPRVVPLRAVIQVWVVKRFVARGSVDFRCDLFSHNWTRKLYWLHALYVRSKTYAKRRGYAERSTRLQQADPRNLTSCCDLENRQPVYKMNRADCSPNNLLATFLGKTPALLPVRCHTVAPNAECPTEPEKGEQGNSGAFLIK